MKTHILVLALLCLWMPAAFTGEEAPKDDGAKELAVLGEKAKKIKSIHLTLVLTLDAIDMHEDPEDDEPKAVARHESSVMELWYLKKDGLFRSDDIQKGKVRGLLVNDLGAIMWLIQDRKFVAKALRFPRERFLLREGEFNLAMGGAGRLSPRWPLRLRRAAEGFHRHLQG